MVLNHTGLLKQGSQLKMYSFTCNASDQYKAKLTLVDEEEEKEKKKDLQVTD